MSHSYIAYIDESGDDGLKNFRSPGQGGSTHWLVISCCITRYVYDLELVRRRDEIGKLMPTRKKRDIHFRELSHSQKLMACQKIAEFPIRSISILSNKTTIADGTYKNPNQLYHYLTRYLIERISWFCRDMRPHVPEGNGKVKIVFSRRGGMNYKDFQDYLRKLETMNADGLDNQIYWPVIDIDAVEAKDHSTRAGLQIADCISSAFRTAVDADEFGNFEDRYAKSLKANTYNRKGKYLSYGIKPIPPLDKMTLIREQTEFFDYFNDKK